MSDRLIERVDGGFRVAIGDSERDLLAKLFGELRDLLLKPEGAGAGGALARLFPVVHPDHPEREAEYQHLMGDELVASRLAAIQMVESTVLGPGAGAGEDGALLAEEGLHAFMQAVNSLRLVLGTILGVTDHATDGDLTDLDGDEVDPALAPEHQVYAYLSWMLESAVDTISSDDDTPDAE